MWHHQPLVVQSLSRVHLSAAPWTAARQAPLSSAISWSLFRPMSIELSQGWYLTIDSSAAPFSFCLQFFLALGLFQ